MNQTSMLRWNMSFNANDENDKNKGSESELFSHYKSELSIFWSPKHTELQYMSN